MKRKHFKFSFRLFLLIPFAFLTTFFFNKEKTLKFQHFFLFPRHFLSKLFFSFLIDLIFKWQEGRCIWFEKYYRCGGGWKSIRYDLWGANDGRTNAREWLSETGQQKWHGKNLQNTASHTEFPNRPLLSTVWKGVQSGALRWKGGGWMQLPSEESGLSSR